MLAQTHQLFIEILDGEKNPVCRQEAAGFQPIYEDLHFFAVRAGLVPNDGCAPAGKLEPVFKDGRVAGVTGTLAGVTKTWGTEIFKHHVHELLLNSDILKRDGEETPTYQWRVAAEEAAAPAGRKLQVRMRRRPYPFIDGTLSSLGIPSPDAADEVLHVYVAANVVEQLRGETANSLGVERADILCGTLLRDHGSAALLITSRFPLAFQTEASAAHVAFSPLTFQAAQQEHLRRGTGESLVGWHHNHPPKCGQDCLLVVPACDNDSVFLSVDDYAVFLASFCSPYMVGLISGKGKDRSAAEPILRAYGWRDGVVQEIPFTVFGE